MRYVWIALVIITLIISLVFYQQIAQAIVVLGYTLVGLLVVVGILGTFFGSWYLAERLKMVRAARLEAEKSAHVMVLDSNGESWVRDTDDHATWRNLTGTPALYVNGQQAPPSDWEIDLHRFKLLTMAQPRAAAQVISGQAQLLPEPESVPLDLLRVFTQPTQSYAIIGGQQTGKTFQARHIAAYWVRQGFKPVVIGPKWDMDEWHSCYLIGGGGNMAAVEWGIGLVRKLVEQRHAAPVAHKSHPIQPIFFDDWTPIVDAVSNARALVLEATTLYASVNVLLYFIIHSDTANAWGVDRKGAALKDNFIKLLIVPKYDHNGLIIRSQTQGFIRFAGDSTERQVQLFTTSPVMEGKPKVVSFKETDTLQETQIKELHRQGHSLNEIARQVYGSTGGKQTLMIKQILGLS